MVSPAKRGRGRPPKAPKAPTAPAIPSTADATGWLGLAGDAIRARLAAGKALAHHDAKLLREATWAAKHADYWPGVDEAAADLGMSPNTVRGYAEQGCPGIEAHMPVHRASVLGWLLKNAHASGGQAPATRQTIEDVELRIKSAKADQLEKRLLAEAEDNARQGVLQACADTQQGLLERVPRAVAAGVPFASPAACEEAVRAAITSELAALAAEPIRHTTPETP